MAVVRQLILKSTFIRIVLPLGLSLAVAGCDDAPVEVAKPGDTAELARRAGEPSKDWLTIDDVRSPAHWLVERSSGRDFVGDDPRLAKVVAALDLAESRFHENRRMLANRTAQLTDVSREHGEAILPEAMLSDLAFADRHGERAWFGVRAQAYIVLRQSVRNHAAAVAAIRDTSSEAKR